MRTFATIEKLLKVVRSESTSANLDVQNLSTVGSITAGTSLSTGTTVDVGTELTVPIITPGSAGATPGAGAVGTATAPSVSVINIADQIITTIKIDLTGLKAVNTDNDVIGLEAATPPAYLTQITTAVNGIINKVEMTCVELPTASADVLLNINLTSDAAGDKVISNAGAGFTLLIDANGNYAAGLTKTAVAGTNPAANDYLYLTEGATHTGACVFTGGQFVIKLYGYALI